MEKLSSIDKVVGNISEEDKGKIFQDNKERFDNQIFEDLKGKEREKTPEELEIILLVNEATNEIRQKYGLSDFDVPSKNIHILLEEEWPTRNKSLAFYNSKLQAVALRERSSRIAF